MTPAEVIAMRDKLAVVLHNFGMAAASCDDWADHLIKTGWVVAPPKNEGEENDTKN